MGKLRIFHNGKIATNAKPYFAEAVAVEDGKISAVGRNSEVLRLKKSDTEAVDLCGQTVIPGLNDSHLHIIRGGLHYNLELRWDGVPSLADALRMLKEQAARTPAPQWVRVVGGWNEFQFAERRMPTLDEINAVASETPVFVLHLYDHALLNAAALRAVGYTKGTPNPPGGEIQRDKQGNPTGLLIARPNAGILYSTLAKGPVLSFEDQLVSTRHFMREMNRLGVTSAIDAGGGFQNYPDDYGVISELHRRNQMTVRVAYNLFTQRPKHELEDFELWTSTTKLHQGDSAFRLNGAGEMLVFSAADFEDFLEPRPNLDGVLERELEAVIRLLAAAHWPFRLHSTYDESIDRFLNVLDDGHGMDDPELEAAMRLGDKSPLDKRTSEDLGRFGNGLKTASFSQCRSLTVASRKIGKDIACLRWDLDEIAARTDGAWALLEGVYSGPFPAND
jgi:predicted amidohydrolase YtcJ